VAKLPSGTVTFVFTDIEGSTELLKRLGDGYGEVLAQHRRVVRETFAAANGVEIDTQGDAFFFAFPRARDAVDAAVRVQRAHAEAEWPAESAVRVRIGLHTGEPAVGEEGYLGLDVVRAARICTAGRGGQILLSESARALVGSTLPEGVSLFPLGERHLRGIDEPERVYELAIDGLETNVTEESAAPAASESSPAPSSEDAERRFDDFGKRLAARIQDRVFRSLEGSMREAEEESPRPTGEDADLDDLAARSASLEERIRARVEAALRAKGIPPDEAQ
jgi:class 3 adenylate cyclase